MFTCSICGETFGQIPTYATLCGHVFHSHCILLWLESSLNCPQCPAVVCEEDLIKLFLVDNELKELNSLRNQLNKLREDIKDHEKSILNLQKESQNLQLVIYKNEETVKDLKEKNDTNQKIIHDLRMEFSILTIDLENSLDLIQRSEKQLQLKQNRIISIEKELYKIKSVNRIDINNLKVKIADLESEKACLQDKCRSLEKQNIPSSSSEVKIVDEHLLLHYNEIQNTLCEHDPKLTVPSKQFLLGCVFLFIGDQDLFESICSHTFKFEPSIIKHGGSVEQSYSSRVTHLICGTQKHQLVEQGLRDGKRCVTNHWLNDIIIKECLLPPWLAYHFPLPFSDENDWPCDRYQIAITNFEKNDYDIISDMVKLTGAYVVNLISPNTDVVVTKNLAGDMINAAIALKIPIVNVQWLNDILVGAISGFEINGIKYQRFHLSNPFLVNHDTVSHLMEAWKFPVNFLQNNEAYDSTESSAGSSTCKRQKTNSFENEVIDLLNDESNSNDLPMKYGNIDPRKKPCVLFSGFETEVEEELKQIVIELGGKIATNYHEGTHLVLNKPSKTLQLVYCLTTVNHIVEKTWIRNSRTLNKFDDEKYYHINKIYDNLDGVNNKIVCDVQRVLQNSERQKLFEHKIFHVTPGIEFPTSDCLEQMITSAGGTVEKEMKNMFKKRTPDTYFIISCLKDLNLIEDILEMKPFLYTSDFIMNAIMLQHVNVNQNYLLVNEQIT